MLMFLSHMNLLFCFCSFIFPLLAASGAPLIVRWMARSFFHFAWPRSSLGKFFCVLALGYPLVNLIDQTRELTDAVASDSV